MLKRRFWVLALAVGLGLITSVVVYRAVKSGRGTDQGTEQVLVAAVNIGVGEAITPSHVKMASWPTSVVEPGILRTSKDAEGRVARTSIVTGEPIFEAKLAPPGQGGLMPVLVPPGKRGVTIKVDEAVQRSGFVVPNSRVDVLVTMSRKVGLDKESRIVLQDVTVLASDQTVEMKDNKPVTMTTITMALLPEEAERLALAQNEGKVTLALRNMQDNSRVTTAGITTGRLLGEAPPAPAQEKKAASGAGSRARRARGTVRAAAAPPAPQVHQVSVVRGVTSTDYLFTRDPARGWVESPGKTDAAAKPH